MKRNIVVVIFILLTLVFSCDVTLMGDGRSVNEYIFPYVEFTLSEDGTYYTASIVAGAALSEVYIASYVDDFSGSIPVKYFNGFQNPEDEVNIEKVVFESNVTELSPEILESNTNKYTIEYASMPEYKTWDNLPTLPNKREGEFDGWISNTTGEYVKSGDLITSDNASISPVWKAHGDLRHYDAKAPTCTEIGWTEYYRCSTCGWTDYVELERISHEPVHHEEVEATCTSSGIRDYYECKNCRRYFSDSECGNEIDQIKTPALGHVTVYMEEKEATCTESGVQAHYECARCNKLFSDENTTTEVEESSLLTSALGHNWVRKQFSETASCTWDECTRCGETQDSVGHTWNDGVVTKSPTKTNHGVKTFTCTICKNARTEDIAPLGEHTWVDSDPVAPACTKRGYTTRTCSECNITYNYKYVDAIGHTMEIIEEKDATCTTNGNCKYYACSVCNNLYKDRNGINETTLSEVQEGRKATGHKYSESVFEKNENYHWHVCYVCGVEIKGSKTGHSYSVETTTYQAEKANCTEPAKYYYTCVCGEKGTETFEYGTPLGHQIPLTKVDETTSTCIKHGNYAYWFCERCGELFLDAGGNQTTTLENVKKPLASHVWDEGWQSDGEYHWHVCINGCGATTEKEVHSEKMNYNETYHWCECSVCEKRFGAMEAHVFDESGTYCTKCGYIVEKTDTDSGFDVKPVYKEPTGKISSSYNKEKNKWTFTLVSTNPDSIATGWEWYVDGNAVAGANKATFEFIPPRDESYVIFCIFWNNNGAGSSEINI